jgi:hypothetical protein
MRPARVYLPQGCDDTLPYVTNQYSLSCDQRLAPVLSTFSLGASAQRGTSVSEGVLAALASRKQPTASLRVPPEARNSRQPRAAALEAAPRVAAAHTQRCSE